MPLIYKDFAAPIRALNFEAAPCPPEGQRVAGPAVAIPGGRGYLRYDFQAQTVKPHLDEIHYTIYDESWYTQEDLAARFARETRFHDRVYAGAAGTTNLEYIASIRAPGVILFDVNPLQTLFWDGLFAMIAAHPERHDCAAMLRPYSESLYYKIDQMFGADVIRDMTAPVQQEGGRPYWDRYSPYRRMKYDEVERRAEAMLKRTDTWLGDDARYRHLHLLAKHKAVAPVTIDITDRADCARLAAVLAAVPYRTGRYEAGQEPVFATEEQTGAAVGLLYRSNIGYFLRHSAERVAEAAKHNATPIDYSANPVTKSTYRKAHENIRSWMAPEAHLLASDRLSGSGHWAQFVPRLFAIKGTAKTLDRGPQPG